MGSKHSDAIALESCEQHFSTAMFSVATAITTTSSVDSTTINSFEFDVCACVWLCRVHSFNHYHWRCHIIDFVCEFRAYCCPLRWFHQFRYDQVHLHILSIRYDNGRLILLHFTSSVPHHMLSHAPAQHFTYVNCIFELKSALRESDKHHLVGLPTLEHFHFFW